MLNDGIQIALQQLFPSMGVWNSLYCPRNQKTIRNFVISFISAIRNKRKSQSEEVCLQNETKMMRVFTESRLPDSTPLKLHS